MKNSLKSPQQSKSMDALFENVKISSLQEKKFDSEPVISTKQLIKIAYKLFTISKNNPSLSLYYEFEIKVSDFLWAKEHYPSPSSLFEKKLISMASTLAMAPDYTYEHQESIGSGASEHTRPPKPPPYLSIDFFQQLSSHSYSLIK